MLERKASYLKQEILGGFSTFATMVYVIVVNPTILNAAGVPFAAAMIATILTTSFATFMMGALANVPFAIAPGMGVSAYFAYSLILKQNFSWQGGLGIVFMAALFLFIFTITRLRAWIIHQIPSILSQAITAGVGLFLVFIGLKAIGLIEQSGFFVKTGSLFNSHVAMSLLGLFVIYVLLQKDIKSAFIIAIGLNWILALLFGLTQWQGVVSLPPSLSPTFLQLDFSIFHYINTYRAVLAIFLVTLFDSTCALTALANKAGLVNKENKIKGLQKILISDGLFSMVGAILGTASLAIHLESMSGIQAGARKGLSNFLVAGCFLLCLFFYPLISSIPHFATAPVLITIGLMMASSLKSINKTDLSTRFIFLLTALIMPLTMSIYYGFVFGFWAYTIVHIIKRQSNKIPILCWILSAIFLIQRLSEAF